MEIRQYINCSETQNQEKYLCLNKACYTSKKKQLHCHECLVKLHKTAKNNINHYEEFVTLDSILNDLQRRNIKKFEIYNQTIFDAYQYKKAKFQELCSLKQFSNKSSEFQNQIFKKIEQLIDEIQKILSPQIEQIRLGQQFSKDKLQNIIEQYLSNDQLFEEALKQAFQEVKTKVEAFINSIELQDVQNLKKKSHTSEKRVTEQLGTKISPRQENQIRSYGILLIFVIIPFSYLVYKLEQIEAKISNVEQNFTQFHEKQNLFQKEHENYHKETVQHMTSEINVQNNLLNSLEKNILNLQETQISNDSKQILKLVQLQKKIEEEIQKVRQQFITVIQEKEQITKVKEEIQISFPEKSELINEDYITNRLIAETQLNFTNIHLLYKSKRDGLSLKDFWRKVNKIGSTLLIAKFYNGPTIGALTLPPFIPSFYGDYVVDALRKSFIFSFTLDQIFPVKSENFTLYTKYLVGPQYGQGPDLSLQGENFDQCSSYLGYTYEKHNITEPRKHLLGGSHRIQEMEVFLLS